MSIIIDCLMQPTHINIFQDLITEWGWVDHNISLQHYEHGPLISVQCSIYWYRGVTLIDGDHVFVGMS